METNESGIAKRRMHSKAERRQIVEETLRPGASASRVARAHGVNANLVSSWRKLYREGRLEGESRSGLMLPVKVSETLDRGGGRSGNPGRGTTGGTIDIDLGHARVRIEGDADPACVRAALEGLVR